MVEPQASRFWQAAVKSGLLDEATMAASWDTVPPDKRTLDAIDRRLARQLVNAGRLTLWQAQQILAGRWQGLRIDKYELQDVIGQGGMGRVYLARDTRLNRKVALKILSRERMTNPRALARFRREAKVGAQLQHENLVRIYDEGDAHGVRYLVMEYIEGKTVGHVIAELGKLPPATAASLGRQVALGLEHLHQKGLLHRDVNPMNILIDHDGTAKLTDLGLAIDLGDLDDIVTRDGATVGTFDYISPEQAKHSRSVDARSDVYSLGCTLYHMISGRVPFPSPSLPEKLYAHQLNDPDPLANSAPGVPEGLVAVVSKMMKKSVDDRYPRAADVARALEPFIGGSLLPAEIASATAPTREGPVDPPSGATPPGSDPDLDLKHGSNEVSPPTAPASDPMDIFRINLGPEPPLFQGRSTARPTAIAKEKAKSKGSTEIPTQPEPGGERTPIPFPTRIVLTALGSVAGAALVVALLIFVWSKLPSRSKAIPKAVQNAEASKTKDSNEPPPEIAIRYPDNTEVAQPDLREAITRLGGSGGEIVLRTKKTLKVGDPKKSLRLSGGHLVIKAVDGARPELSVDLAGPMPWIEADPLARLTLIGLSIRAEIIVNEGARPGASPPTLIAANGGVALERCLFTTTGTERSIRAVAAEGLDTRVTGCMFEGFDRPISLAMYPGADAKFSHCIFVRDITTDPLAGWAVAAVRKNAPTNKPRRITIDRCTALGAGLLVAEGFTADGPLTVSVSQSATRTSALLMTPTPKDALPKALVWTGKDNAYAITGVAWVVVPPRGFDGMKDGPSNLKTWAELMKADTGGRDEVIKFAGPSQGEGKVPEDFAVIVDGKTATGADPAKVGPGGKP
ncbi:MAG: serine/threonine protein kinase [Planctomycetota bacterium]|nr:serine/threonine protein kinase [Planctomycetota bacterium]